MKLMTSLPAEVVETQLERIIQSRQFCNAPRLSRFLTFLVEETLAGRAERLKGYTIGLEVFDKPEDFDPQTDTIVRVQARALRQRLDQYYAQDGKEDPVHITIAKGAYEPAFFVSWDGERPEKPDDVPTLAKSGKPSIAVLPFEQLCPDKGVQFLSDGLAEGTIACLSRFRDLSVFSRSTTKKARLDGLSILQIYDLFQPDFVLEGSFRLRADMVETRIKLIDAAADEIIMTDRIDMRKEPGHIYEMQDEMVLRIAARIAVEYGPIGQYARRASRSGQSSKWETYAWISRYFQAGVQLDHAGRKRIKAGLTQAIETDPTSSEAHAALGMIEIEQYRTLTGEEAARGDPEQALKHALRAVQCDPENAMAHQSVAIAYFHLRRFVDFRAAVQRALKLNPGHGDMLAMFGVCFAVRGEWDAAMPLLERAVTLNPLHPGWYQIPMAMFLLLTKGPRHAIAEMEKDPMPGYYAFHAFMMWFHVEDDNMEAAQIEKARLLDAAPDAAKMIRRHFETWCLNDDIAERVFAAFRKAGLVIAT